MSSDLHRFLALSAEGKEKSVSERYREWSRKEIMDTHNGKRDGDEIDELLLAGGLLAAAIGVVMVVAWLRP